MKTIIIFLSMASLAGCATPALNTPHANLERAETLAEQAYVQAVPFMTPAQQKVAWADLQQVRALYNSGQDLTLAVQTLMAALPKTGN
jgi:hypothetical protein